jgi:hypothetical protein
MAPQWQVIRATMTTTLHYPFPAPSTITTPSPSLVQSQSNKEERTEGSSMEIWIKHGIII